MVAETKIDVSIVIPTYNRLWSLPDTIASCRRTHCSYEIVVVDDGSTDGTWDWLKNQPDVLAIRQDNWGKDNAVNRAFANARGEYIRFLDSDDLLPPHANDIQLAAARASNADIVVAGTIERIELERKDYVRPWIECDDFIAQQLGECDSSHYSAYLFRRAFLDANVRHRQEYGVRDDRMFVIEAAFAQPRVVSVAEPCLIHVHHARDRLQFQTGPSAIATNWQDLQMWRRAAKFLEARGLFTARRKRAMTSNLWYLAHRMAASHISEARKIVEWIHELDPDFVLPDKGVVGAAHRTLGFSITHGLIGIARRGRNVMRGMARSARP